MSNALKLNPQSFEAHFRMAVSFELEKLYDRAGQWYEKTIRLQPSCAVAYKNLAHCRMEMNDIPGAEANLQRSVQVQPNYFDGYLALAEFYARRGDWVASQASIGVAEGLRPGDSRVAAMRRALDKYTSGKN